MDLDSVSLRPFPENFWNPPNGSALAFLKEWKKNKGRLACGVVMAQPNSSFIKRWYESYRTFNDSIWARHCVGVSTELAKKYPDEITTLPQKYFYSPSMDKTGVRILWGEHGPNDTSVSKFDGSYAPHYWGSGSREFQRIDRISPSYVLNTNTGLFQILRGLLPHPYFTVVLNACNCR